MRKRLHLGLVLALLPWGAILHAGEVVDRIVATVNGHIVVQSDWDQALSYQALVDNRSVDQFSLAERKATLNRLIDQELIRQQINASEFSPASTEDIDKRIQEIRKQRPDGASDDGWKAALDRNHLTTADLRFHIANEINEMRALDAHFRPGLQIDPHSVETYYRERLLPELRATGAKEIPLADVAPQIRELLAQQKINDLLIAWLKTLRAESNIRTPGDPTTGGGGAR